jgi:hypothetical protein
MGYEPTQIIVKKTKEGGYWATCPEVPGANGQGETVAEAKRSLIAAVALMQVEPTVFDRIRALRARQTPLPKCEAAKLIRAGRHRLRRKRNSPLMHLIPMKAPFPQIKIYPSTRIQFEKEAIKWRKETRLTSLTEKIVSHPSYKKIIAMGEPVLPLILARVAEGQAHWFTALRQITGERPAANATTFGEAQRAWLNWAKTKQLATT